MNPLPAENVARPDGPRGNEAAADVRALLDQNPELRGDRSMVLDLIYDEYCRLAEAGAAPDPDTFCDRYPTFGSALRKVLAIDGFLEDNLHLLDDEAPVPWPAEGETFLGYRLLRELGRGAFARVFLAAQPELGDRLVAVKISPLDSQEAHTLGRIDHPNVVKVHAVDKDPTTGLTAVCMPYLGSATLGTVLAKAFPPESTARPKGARVILDVARAAAGPPDGEAPVPPRLLETGTYPEAVALLGAQIAEALSFLHARGVIHRDLKPSNVLLCRDGRPMLLDFNLSADARAGRERLGGTLAYMAPEQVQTAFGDGSASAPPIDGRSDLFSLGVILYELLSGRQPFSAVVRGRPAPADCAALLAQQLAGAPPLRPLRPGASSALVRVIERCLAFDRSARPRDAAEVAAALRRDLRPWRRLLRQLARHPKKVAAAACVALALAGAAGGHLAARPPHAQRMLEEARLAVASGNHEAALRALDGALAHDPQLAEAHFLRGRVYQRQNSFKLARTSYEEALRLAPGDGRVDAALAYCLAKDVHHDDAVQSNQAAVANGFATGEVYNNLAYSQIHNGEREAARASLDQALALAPGLPAAHRNRLVLLRIEIDLQKNVPPAEVDRAIGDALTCAPESAEMCEDAADLCAAAGRKDQALTYLKGAHKFGLRLLERPRGKAYGSLFKHPDYVALVKTEPGQVPRQTIDRLADPLAATP
jgi:serine/threonine protein kinase/Tfp pilus assembly protein PilF